MEIHAQLYPILERRNTVLLLLLLRAAAPMSRSGYPPWILKRGGLESSARILLLLLLLLCHTQGIPPGFCKGVDWRALVESCYNYYYSYVTLRVPAELFLRMNRDISQNPKKKILQQKKVLSS